MPSAALWKGPFGEIGETDFLERRGWSTKQSAGVPGVSSTTRRQFEQWRRQHPHHKRLPQELWDKAVALARQYGINRTACLLGLNYDSLKVRLQAVTAGVSKSPPDSCPFGRPERSMNLCWRLWIGGPGINWPARRCTAGACPGSSRASSRLGRGRVRRGAAVAPSGTREITAVGPFSMPIFSSRRGSLLHADFQISFAFLYRTMKRSS